METNDAISLLKKEDVYGKTPQHWADFGSGSGTFTIALSRLLPAGSEIIAVDTDLSSLRKIPLRNGNVDIRTIQANFVADSLVMCNLDGVIMANSLHFVNDKESFLKNIRKYLKQSHILIIIEYNTDISNPWVPFPISFVPLKKLLEDNGYKSVEKINSIPSKYNKAGIYSLIAKRISSGQ